MPLYKITVKRELFLTIEVERDNKEQAIDAVIMLAENGAAADNEYTAEATCVSSEEITEKEEDNG